MNNKTKQIKQTNKNLQTFTRLSLLALALLLALPTDGNQNVVWDAQYPPFGQAMVDENLDGAGTGGGINTCR